MFFDCCYDFVLLFVGHFGVDGDGEYFAAGLIGLGEVGGLVTEVAEAFLLVEGDGVKHGAADAFACEEFACLVAAGDANDAGSTQIARTLN